MRRQLELAPCPAPGEAPSRHRQAADYWRRQLAGAPAGLDLPTDHPRPAVRTHNRAVRGADLPARLTADLREFCRRAQVTPYMLLLAAFDVLLARWSGQEDLLVGSPAAHGGFVVLRAQLADVSSFAELLSAVRETVLEAHANQAVQLETLVEELLPERDASRSPFFQVTFSLRAAGAGHSAGEGWAEQARLERAKPIAGSAEPRDHPARPAGSAAPGESDLREEPSGECRRSTADLRRSVSPRSEPTPGLDLALAAIDAIDAIDAGAALRLEVDYDAELFAAATVRRLLGHLERLLEEAVAAPQRGWRDLLLLTEAERAHLLHGLNDTGSTPGPALCVHQLFEAQAARHPDRTALVAPDRRLTYRQLNGRADRLARRLRSLGLGPEVLAGVLMDRTADLIVALLAVLKAGGAYVPLDPGYPRQRLLLMLETSRAAVLVTRRSLAEPLGAELPAGLRTLFLQPGREEEPAGEEPEEEEPRQEPGVEGAAGALPGNLAYVIFTSGSTGVPKGVAIEHRSVVAMTRWARTVYSPEEVAGVLASTSICFDLSAFEIFFTLAAGGKVVLVENALALPDAAAAQEVTLINTVPSAMTELLVQGRLPSSVRTVNLAGQALKGSLVKGIHERLGSVERVFNLYGPTEDTTYSTWSAVPRGAAHPSIGRPLTGEAAYVLDPWLRPVPLGVPGELYLGGEGVTRGYLHRPDLTAERYVPNPYGPPGSRMYRVGDLVRYLPSGELDFLGRLDHQVKVRGFRIELGEIEAALTRHPDVREAAVLARPEDQPEAAAAPGDHGGTRLIAYVETERDLSPGELRNFLRVSLPDYMVPSGFVRLRWLPLTPNGKIDRRALAAMPLQPQSVTPREDRPPASHAEEVLAGIWSEIFGRRVGVGESFFDLGGDSLLATRVVARVRAALGLELPPSSVLEAFTVAALAERVERVEQAERAALAAGRPAAPRGGPLLAPIAPSAGAASRGHAGAPGWSRRDGMGEPLSLAQRRLWFLERLAPGTPANNVPTVMRLDGPLALGVLDRSLEEIAARHEALRTTIELGPDGEPRQLVAAPSRLPLALVDLSGLPVPRRLEESRRLAREEARRPFVLGAPVASVDPVGHASPVGHRGPSPPKGGALWRRLLVRAGEREHDLLVTFHHLIADGESVQVLERELAALYAAFLGRRPSPLPLPAAQPADVAAWERERSTPESLAPHLAYFQERLAGAPAALDLPADLPRPAARTWHGTSHALALPPALSRGVREFARGRRATTYMTLLAAWVALLRRVTGQDDVVVGTVLAHRGRPEIEALIGFFATTLPLRVEHPGDPAFAELLDTVRAGALGLYAHQDVPLEQLTAALRPGRPPSFDPLFQAFFALHGNAGRREMAPGLSLTWREEEHGAAQFDLVLDLEDGGETIAGRLVGSADLFTPATVERLALGWAALLADAVARPEAPVSTLALLGAAERHALLVEWSRVPRPPAWSGSAASVPARIAAWAAATPEAIAVLPAEPGLPALTYGEMVTRALRLAGRLRARGVGPDVRVAIYAERSPETLVGMLAVLAAGGAFLPLDPAHPPERLAGILEDARVPVLLAGRALAAALPAGGATLVPLDGAGGIAALDGSAGPGALDSSAGPAAPDGAGGINLVLDGAAGRPRPIPDGPVKIAAVDPGDLAYMIYTSGSTGKPKGVLILHHGFLGAVEALAERSGIGPESRVLQFASASFDASVWEIWSALIAGATVVLARPEDLLPGPPLLATLRRRRITNVFLTPTALAALPDGADRELPDLRGLVVGGEAFPPDLVARWAAGRRLWNAYGPTEGSICATMARLGEDGQTPIGRPIAGHRLLVLGRHLEILPLGVSGELYLGGVGLARGYLGKPDLTARAFLPDPISRKPGARVYRTGDLVRFRPDGQLEFLGRADRQVKVRGFRIEPGEIEAQIAEHPGVREAAVVAYEAAPRDLRLAAFVAAASPAAPSADELRAFLRARLPEHMVPSAFHFLAALPLSPSGKVDRRALPLPAPDEPETTSGAGLSGVAPRTTAEQLLAGIWEEVLGRAEVGAADDFFDLGGHSLLIGKVLARVRAVFGVELSVRAAFEARTLAALARRIEETLRALPPDAAPWPPLVRVSRAEPLPLSFGQHRLWFLDRLEPGSPVYNLAVALRLAGPLDAAALERGLNEVLRRHEVLRTTFAEGPDGAPRQVAAPFHATALPRVDLAALPPAVARSEARRQAAWQARRPFDLVRGPVARPLLLRLGEREHRLLFCCHHIVFDGWSIAVLQRELGALYGAFAAGRPSPLSEPALQYGDFAVWERRCLSGEMLGSAADLRHSPEGSTLGRVASPLGQTDTTLGRVGSPLGETDTSLRSQLAYWRERLAGAPAAVELPADRPRPPVQNFRGSALALAFPAGLGAGLRGIVRGEGSTLFITALAAFAALLGRFTGQEDLVVGSPVATRAEAGLEDMLGFFVNTLALRTDLAGDPSFGALLGRVRESALSAYAHQDLPFERLVEELQPERDLSRSPLFQVMFSLDPAQGGELAPGLSCERLRVDTATAMFDLALFLEEENGELTAVLEYATDLFDAATVSRLGRSYLRLLAGLVEAGVGLRVSELPLLGAAERWQVLGEWNAPSSPGTSSDAISPGGCLHDLVAAQVERTPSAVALVAGSERITYRDLGLRAGRLARRLAALGVGPEVRVGVCMSRSPALVATLLGILEAGGTYVPLDPTYPRERLGFMLEDAGAAVLVAETALAARLPASRTRLLVLDVGGLAVGESSAGLAVAEVAEPTGAAGPEEPINGAEPAGDAAGERPGKAKGEPAGAARALPGNLAYLIYTSGSTGRPKAVAIEHRSAVAFVHWALRAFAAAELEAVLASTSISFDLSIFELFVPLARGGRVILAANALELPELPAAGEVTLVNTVPSAMAELVRAGALPAGVRSVNLAGEPLKGSLAQALYASGVERVRNLYGPSEDTTYSTFEVVERGNRREPTIGRPLAGSRAVVLDRNQRPVPLGVPGELYLGGAGLARGYLGHPELTAERFVPDPRSGMPGGPPDADGGGRPGAGDAPGWCAEAGARLYRTGDLVRHLPDGRLDYLGRTDHQVKVRGYRIELGEIELALESHPQVAAAVVVAPEAGPGERRLIAYVEPDPAAPGKRAGGSELRVHLRRQVPEYMVPAFLVWLDELPRTPNGKVDRRALPAPMTAGAAGAHAATAAAAPTAYSAPRGALEELIAGFWAELLRRDRIGRDENFFELGGHSLLAAQVISRLRGATGAELPLRRLFQAPTVKGLAACVAALLQEESAAVPPPPLTPLPAAERAGDLPLSFAQQRLWFLDRLEPGSPVYNLPRAYRASGRIDAAALAGALREVVRRHETLRTTFVLDAAGEPRQRIAAAGSWLGSLGEPRAAGAAPGLPVADLSGLPEAAMEREANRLSQAEARRPFDLGTGPLLRALLLRCREAGDRLVLNLHHIAADGWSLEVLARELGALYPVLAGGTQSVVAGALCPVVAGGTRSEVAGAPCPVLAGGAESAGAPALASRRRSLPELAVQYADFAAWQRRFVSGDRLATQLAYWRSRLASPAVLALPADRPRPAVETFRGAQRRRPLAAARVAAARALAGREGATLFMALLSCLVALLHRYTGQDDVAVGTPVAGRTCAEVEPLLGVFVNTLVLRHVVVGLPSGRELLAGVRDTALGAFTHQDLPFEKLVEELQPERSLARTPFFQAAFLVQDEAPITLGPGLDLDPLPLDSQTAKFDLTLAVLDRGGEHELAVEFSTDLFDAATALRLLEHYQQLLDELCAHPGRPIAELQLLGEAERRQLMTEWNDKARPLPAGGLPRPRLVHELVAEQARLRPEAVAVAAVVPVGGAADGTGAAAACGPGHVLRYGELAARAGSLAWRLRALGVGPEVRVAICADRDPSWVAAVVAVLAAGGAYVSLDPAYPRERLSLLLADAAAPVVLCERRFLERLPEGGTVTLCLEEALELAPPPSGPPPGAWPDSGVTAENLAYVVYTSGSTGQPKGVEITHAGLANLVRWHQRLYEVGAADRSTLVASSAFDASVWELWPYLAAGASLHIPDEETRLDAAATVRWWAREQITLSFLMTPLAEGVLSFLADEAAAPAVPVDPAERALALRALLTGGDRLRRWPVPGSGFRLMNHYGPSEFSVVATVAEVAPLAAVEEELGGKLVGSPPGETDTTRRPPPIGRPIDNTWIFVLDHRLEPVPLGAFGELFVAGAGLARGYLHRPDLTAERFVPNPWSAAAGERMYRTGDRVRWLPTGELDFAGRLDHQVKLHGWRIELGEIEAELAGHPAVRDAAVLLREDRPGAKRLTAYATARPEQRLGGEELREHLAARLPPFMVPAAFVILDEMPLSVHGKLDRQALPAPQERDDASYQAPRTPVEQLLAETFAEVLGLARVGVEDDFFDLGGHSLLGVRLLSRLRARFDVELPLRRLFELPTVARLAAVLGSTLGGNGAGGPEVLPGSPGSLGPPRSPMSPMAPISPASPRPLPPLTPLPRAERESGAALSPAQRQLWFVTQIAPGDPTLNVPFPLLLSGPLDRAALAAALAEIERRHGALRTRFREVNGEVLQWVLPAGPTALPLVDLAALPAPRREAAAAALAGAAARLPFDLAAGPVWRAVLVRQEDRRHWLLLGFHHIVADGWSMAVLEGELAALYEAFASGRPSPLAEPPVQMIDFTAWQCRAQGDDALAEALGYWRRQLAELPTLRLPTDRPRPARPSSRGAARSRLLPAAVAGGLRRLARREEASLFMVMLAAFAAALGRYSDQQDVVVGTPVAQRDRPELEGLIGCFVNNLVLRADLAGDPPFRELVRRARDITLAAHAHAHLPFARLVEELEPRRDRSRSPLFQVMLTLQTAAEWSRRAGELAIEPLPVHTGTAQYDLTLCLVEKGSELEAAFEFSTDLFDAATVERMLADLCKLAAAVVEQPDMPLSRLPISARPGAAPVDGDTCSSAPAVDTSAAAPTAAAAPAAKVTAPAASPAAPAVPSGAPAVPAAAPAYGAAGRGAAASALPAGEREARVAARRTRLTPEQQALLDRRLRRQAGAAAQVMPQFSARVAIQPNGARPPFFCVHPAGGDVLCYGPLARHLGEDQPFYGFQSPGLGEGAPAFESLEAMAAHYVAEMRRTAPPPYRLGGWSLGGVVAFEMARQLASEDGRGASVALLAILDSPAGLDPGSTVLSAETYDDDAWWLAAIADYAAGLWGKDLGLSYEAMRGLDGEERLRRFLNRLRDVGLPGSEAGLEQLRRLLATFKANTRALQRYTLSAYSGRVTLFRAAGGDGAQAAEPAWGWPAFTRLPVEVEEVPGDHIRCLAEPNVSVLAARLRAHLDRALEGA